MIYEKTNAESGQYARIQSKKYIPDVKFCQMSQSKTAKSKKVLIKVKEAMPLFLHLCSSLKTIKNPE